MQKRVANAYKLPEDVLDVWAQHLCLAGPHTMLCCTWHLNAQCAVWSALSTQCTVNLEHSNALSPQCTRSNGHSALSATHLLGTKVPVRKLCVVSCAREPRRPPWASLSLSDPYPGLASPRSSRLRLILQRPTVYAETLGEHAQALVPLHAGRMGSYQPMSRRVPRRREPLASATARPLQPF